jgi:hypothetical protein
LKTKKVIQRNENLAKLKMSLKSVSSEIDCGDKKCSLHHRYLDKCTIFLHTNVSDCKIPCQLDGCKTEIRYYMTCPIWECNDYTTTTLSTTSSTESSSTSAPAPTPSSYTNIFDIVSYISLGVNGLFLVALLIWVIYKICKKQQQSRHHNRDQEAQRQRFPPLLPNDHAYFSLGGNTSSEHSSNENIPLINRAKSNPHSTCPPATFYTDTLTSHVSLSSTPESIKKANDLVEVRNAEREDMLSRVTTFKGAMQKPSSSKSVETRRETKF